MRVQRLMLLTLLPVLAAGWSGCQKTQSLPRDVTEAAGMLDGERAAAKREGIPLVNADLYPHRPVPDSRNAAKPYAEAVSSIRKSESAKTIQRLTNAGRAWEIERRSRQELAMAVTELGPTFQKVRAASKLPYWDTGKSLDRGAGLLFPEYAELKNLAKLLVASAHSKALAGRLDSAFDDLACAFRIARHAGQDHFLIPLLIRIAIEHIVLAEVQRIEKASSKNVALQQRCVDFVKEFSGVPHLRDYMVGELVSNRASILVNMKDLKDVKQLSDTLEIRSPDLKGDPSVWRRAWETRLLQLYRRVLPQMPKDSEHTILAKTILKREVESEEAAVKSGQLSHVLNSLFFPVLVGVPSALGRAQASQRLTETYAKLLLYRQSHGSFPSALGALGPAPIDPLDGKPIRYRKTAKGFLIYSVDRDGKDDGGVKRKVSTEGPVDFVLEFP